MDFVNLLEGAHEGFRLNACVVGVKDLDVSLLEHLVIAVRLKICLLKNKLEVALVDLSELFLYIMKEAEGLFAIEVWLGNTAKIDDALEHKGFFTCRKLKLVSCFCSVYGVSKTCILVFKVRSIKRKMVLALLEVIHCSLLFWRAELENEQFGFSCYESVVDRHYFNN